MESGSRASNWLDHPRPPRYCHHCSQHYGAISSLHRARHVDRSNFPIVSRHHPYLGCPGKVHTCSERNNLTISFHHKKSVLMLLIMCVDYLYIGSDMHLHSVLLLWKRCLWSSSRHSRWVNFYLYWSCSNVYSAWFILVLVCCV